jgi:para-nitrobenzyl esterase
MTEPPTDPNFCTVETTHGRVRGLVHSGIREFRGVPYGASTAGPNRFRGPQPPIPWTGVRDCFGHAPVSPQIPSDVGGDYVRLVQFDLNVALGGMSEDCLHLNVWTPGTESGAKRAVLGTTRCMTVRVSPALATSWS